MPKLLFSAQSAADHFYPKHPESSSRVDAIKQAFQADLELQRNLQNTPEISTVANDAIHATHAPSYLDQLKRRCSQIPSSSSEALRDPEDPDGPTYATSTTYANALHAASSAAELVHAVVTSPPHSAVAFSACRPPGHHSSSDEYMGFCLINSIAVATAYAQMELGLKKVSIIDFDVHHGNGTSDIFYQDPSVLFIDIHRDGVWPGSGLTTDIGTGDGRGTTINIPLPEYSGHGAALQAIRKVVVPALHRFDPDLILISAGFDAHDQDPLDCLQYQSITYHAMTAAIVQAADELCQGRCVAVLEGGYNPEAVGEAAVEMARAMVKLPSGRKVVPAEEMSHPEPSEKCIDDLLNRIIKLHGL